MFQHFLQLLHRKKTVLGVVHVGDYESCLTGSLLTQQREQIRQTEKLLSEKIETTP